MPVKSFVDLKAKMCTYAEDDHEYKKAKGIDENVDVEQKHFEFWMYNFFFPVWKYVKVFWNLKIKNILEFLEIWKYVIFFLIWKDKKEFSLLKKSEKGASMKFGDCFFILNTII